jgi:hypothetical protein
MVVATTDIVSTVMEQVNRYDVTVIVIGNRTRSKAIRAALASVSLPLPVELVEENNSSIEGRYRYLRENTTGLAWLLPIGLRIPARPFDDYVAVILAERYLKLKKGT